MARPALASEEFTAAFARHGRSLWVLASAWVGRDEAADLVQETARVAWECRDRFEPGTDLRAWLAQIARNIAANWRRRRGPLAVSPEELPEVAVRGAPAEPTLDVDGLALSDELAAGLSGLSPIARACLLLNVVMDLSFAEIACMLDMPENTAASHVRRARLALREALLARPLPEVR